MFQKIDHVAVHCSDLERSIAFYRDAFGFDLMGRHDRPGGGIAYLGLGGTVLELTQKAGETMSGYHVALRTTDMDAAVARLAERGVKPVSAPKPTSAKLPGEGDTRRAVYRGPDGEMIEVRG